MNATDFFERREGVHCLPACSESFWSTVFSFFLLHLAPEGGGERTLRIWQPTETPDPPWYEPRRTAPSFDLRGLTFNGVAVEPNTLVGIWPEIDIAMTWVSPDLVLRFVRPCGYEYVFVETKVKTGACLGSNQISSYPRLINHLAAAGTAAHLFVLKSIGCSRVLYGQTKDLRRELGARFGILLWGDVFRAMYRYNFSLPGLSIQTLQAYTNATHDCHSW